MRVTRNEITRYYITLISAITFTMPDNFSIFTFWLFK
nr:MAG TPA: hypothetical protein [Caudoviricetes sp.]